VEGVVEGKMKHILYIAFLILPFFGLGQKKTFIVSKEKKQRIIILDSLIDDFRVTISVTDTMLQINEIYRDFFEIEVTDVRTNQKQPNPSHSFLFYESFSPEGEYWRTREKEGRTSVVLFDIKNNERNVLIDELKLEFLIYK
jgi:hypothetical protein